nr:unnamed protein product [Callosobruchus analis]
MHFFNIKYSLILLNITGCHPRKVGSKFQGFLYYSIFVCGVFVLMLMGINMFNSNNTAAQFANGLAEFFVIFHVLVRLKNIFRFIFTCLTTWMMMTVRLSELPFKCYVPKWMPLRPLIIMEDVVCIAIWVTMICTDALFTTTVTMVSLQVRLLNENFGRIFDVGSFDKMRRRELKEWIEHNCFVLK